MSIVEGFLLRPVDLGLSKVEADDPETREGVRITDGFGRLVLRVEVSRDAAAVGVSEGSATEAFKGAARGLCAEVVNAGVFAVLLVSDCALSVDEIVRLALFANFDTCCAGFSC